MIAKLIAGVLGATVFTSAAMAEYYIVQEKSTKKCKVVESRPTETTWIQIGPVSFKTMDEAQRQVAVVCKEKIN